MTTTETSTGPTEGGARFQAENVVAHGVAIMEAVGMPAEDARLVSESPVTSDMWRTSLARHAAPALVRHR
jgi:hypothetical protein